MISLSISSRLTRDLAENERLNDCYFDKKDWRLCKSEVRCLFFDQFLRETPPYPYLTVSVNGLKFTAPVP